MQVDPMKPKLKPLGNKRLKLKRDEPLSNFGFNFNLRRCSEGAKLQSRNTAAAAELKSARFATKVRLCRLIASTAVLKAPKVSALESGIS